MEIKYRIAIFIYNETMQNAKCKIRELKYQRFVSNLFFFPQIFQIFFAKVERKARILDYELAKPPNLYAIFDPLFTVLSNKLGRDTSREEWTLSLSSIDEKTHRGSASVHRRWKERGPRRNKFQPVKTARWLTRD